MSPFGLLHCGKEETGQRRLWADLISQFSASFPHEK
jgi:hypothetical protein